MTSHVDELKSATETRRLDLEVSSESFVGRLSDLLEQSLLTGPMLFLEYI